MLCVPIPSFIAGIMEPNKLISKSKHIKADNTKTIKEIMKKYIAILSDKEVEFDYQCVQNGG